MNTTTRSLLLIALSSALLFGFVACGEGTTDEPATAGEGVLEDENASFGTLGKADARFSACELREVLQLVNESTTTVETLRKVGIHKRAAQSVVDNRFGPDGVEGTGDDQIILDLKTLDDVKFVGPKTLEAFAKAVEGRCQNDLTKRPFIDADTFKNTSISRNNRNAPELEATMTINGVTGRKLNEILNTEDSNGRTGFQRIRRAKVMEAFGFDYPIDEISWDSDEHDIRELLPYTSYSIERGRFDIDPDDGDRELSLGTDYMFDRYYDTQDYLLLNEGMQLRARIRWDDDTRVRRLLVAAKFDSTIDANGLKSAEKIDQRTEGGTHKDALDNDVRKGSASWSGGPFVAIFEIYKRLAERKVLPNVGGKEEVLLLDPQAYIRSARSRYHMDETQSRALGSIFANGDTRLKQVKGFTETALASGKLDAATTQAAEDVIKEIEGLLDGSLLREGAKANVEALGQDVSALKLPAEFARVSANSHEETQAYHELAKATRAAYADLADKVDAIDRELTGTRGLDNDDYVDMFVEWQKSLDTSLRAQKTYRKFYQAWEQVNTDTEQGAKPNGTWNAFVEFAEAQKADGNRDFRDFEGLDAQSWANLGAHMRFEVLKVSQRQIEAAGTVTLSLWFDIARNFYFDGERRTSGNFIIDTLDYTEMVTPEEWASMTDSQRVPSQSLPPEKVFNTSFVNEVQIELTRVNRYLDKLAELREAAANGDAAAKAKFEGAQFVFDQFTASLSTLSELKGEDIIDEMEDRGAPNGTEWVPAQNSKGKTALLLLSQGVK